jgi:hypothetical protein
MAPGDAATGGSRDLPDRLSGDDDAVDRLEVQLIVVTTRDHLARDLRR